MITGTLHFKNLNELLLENQEDIKPESISWIIDLTEKQRTLNEISEKFKEMLLRLSINNSSIEENEFLQLRIKKTALYFNSIINKWRESFNNHPLKLRLKSYPRKIDSRLKEINLILEENLQKINHCSNGFILDNYLKSMQFFNRELIYR